MKNQSLADRLATSNAAKQALLAKFKARPAVDSPEVLAKQAERARISRERELRTAERERAKREEAERLERQAQEERAAAEKASRAAVIAKEENDRAMVKKLLDYEADLKSKRDARYAARKQRQR
jgi:hypothetical protein